MPTSENGDNLVNFMRRATNFIYKSLMRTHDEKRKRSPFFCQYNKNRDIFFRVLKKQKYPRICKAVRKPLSSLSWNCKGLSFVSLSITNEHNKWKHEGISFFYSFTIFISYWYIFFLPGCSCQPRKKALGNNANKVRLWFSNQLLSFPPTCAGLCLSWPARMRFSPSWSLWLMRRTLMMMIPVESYSQPGSDTHL